MAEARDDVNAAVDAAAAARTDDAKTQAQTDIANARKALSSAVNAAKALAELSSDPGRLGKRAIFVEAAEVARTEDLARLLRAEARTGWAGDVAAAAIPPLALAEVAAARRLRRDNREDAPPPLTAAKLPSRMYAAGKTVMGGDAGSSGEQLRMRGMPIFYVSQGNVRYRYGNDAAGNAVSNLAAIRNNSPALLAGLTIKLDRLEIEMGGQYAPGLDFRINSLSVSAYEHLLAQVPGQGGGQANGYDLTLDFGRPHTSPHGSAGHYWKAARMPTDELANAYSWLKDRDRILPVGVYEVRLSNHLRFDENQEDPDADEPYTADDENSYLTYAAYGFMDLYRPGTMSSTSLEEHSYHRVFPFHVGYDAFKDEAGKRTTDIGDAAFTSGTFKGRTMAVRFYARGDGGLNLTPEVVTRMRGDIQLTATISGTQASNTITGQITNMEDWDSKGYWEASSIIPPSTPIRFGTDGAIDAEGEFTGTFANYPTGYSRGGYRGYFYGPVEDLEAAGTWAMSMSQVWENWAIAGSFGAAMVREDGTYGRVVAVGN